MMNDLPQMRDRQVSERDADPGNGPFRHERYDNLLVPEASSVSISLPAGRYRVTVARIDPATNLLALGGVMVRAIESERGSDTSKGSYTPPIAYGAIVTTQESTIIDLAGRDPGMSLQALSDGTYVSVTKLGGR